MQTFPAFSLGLLNLFLCLNGNWQDIIHIFQVFILLLFIVSLLDRQGMFVLLEDSSRVWLVEKFCE